MLAEHLNVCDVFLSQIPEKNWQKIHAIILKFHWVITATVALNC